MNVPGSRFSENSEQQVASTDSRLQPTPDYGSLGPGTDVRIGEGVQQVPRRKVANGASLIAALIGVFAALVLGTLASARKPLSDFTSFFFAEKNQPATAKDLEQLDNMRPQKQAETLLELSVARTAGASEQISSRVERWPGKLKWNSHVATLSAAAMNSTDMRVRESGIEVELAAYGLAKNSESLEYLLRTAESQDHAQKIWALWALGLMGNRGVQADRVVQELAAHLQDQDQDSRRWTVEGLGLTGSDQSIELLLKAMHDDPVPLVRERAACALAESGMFTGQQRMMAVPQLLNYSDDDALD